MFGFLRARRDQLAYRQAYARCCSFQHLYFGVESLVFLSYEAVFLYLCGADAGMHPGPPANTGTCCRLRTSRRLSDAPDAEMARYCAADWHRDQKAGQFNPLPNSDLIGPARSYAQQCLAQLGWLCADEFGDGCPSSGVVQVGEKRLPARSDSGQWIDAQQPVVVTGQDKFGILVRPYYSTQTESP